MYCSQCGKENPEGNATCFSCGAPLVAPAAAAQPATEPGTVTIPAEHLETQAQAAPQETPTQAAPAAQVQPEAQPQAAPQPQAQPAAQAQAAPQPQAAPTQTANAPYATAGTPTPNPAPAAAPAAAQPQQIYAKGCISCAWDDIHKSEGWVGRTLLLGLINIVPILNWIVYGYCMRWSRQLPMGVIQSMPKQIFVNRGFINGVYCFVLTLVFSLVSGVAAGILGLVPLLGWLAGLALGVFINMFLNVSILRTAIADRLGAGFDFSAIWPTIKRNPGSLLCITLVPGIIIGIILGIVAMIIFVIAGVMVGGDIYQLAMMSNMYDVYGHYGPGGYGFDYGYSYAPFATVMSILGVLMPAFLITYIFAAFCMAFYYLLVFRAMGHWVARYAREWLSDPTITASMNLYPDPAPVTASQTQQPPTPMQ